LPPLKGVRNGERWLGADVGKLDQGRKSGLQHGVEMARGQRVEAAQVSRRSGTELEADIRTWINEWIKDPKPFVWVKAAGQILETLAAYCGVINDSRSECAKS
jgi:hypothetical protein